MKKTLCFSIGFILAIFISSSVTSAYYYYASSTDTHSPQYTNTYTTPTETIVSNITPNFFGKIKASLEGRKYGNHTIIDNVQNGETIQFSIDKASLKESTATWKWNYDSRGIHCSETSENNLLCTVVNADIGSDVWAEFHVSGTTKSEPSNKIGINRLLPITTTTYTEKNVTEIPKITYKTNPKLTYRSYKTNNVIPLVMLRTTNYYNYWRYPYYSSYYINYRSKFPRYYKYNYEN